MSVRIKRGFISDAIAASSDELGIGEDDAFMYWFYSILFDVELEDVPDDEVVDGAGERQIDMFRLEIDDSTQAVDIHLIQVKNTSGFSANTVSLMKAGLEFIFFSPRETYRATKNEKLLEKIENARQAIRQYGNNSVNVSCYFVTLGDEGDISTEAIGVVAESRPEL